MTEITKIANLIASFIASIKTNNGLTQQLNNYQVDRPKIVGCQNS